MEKRSNWLKETSRDIVALGGIPFFILVLMRVYITPQTYYFYQFLIGGLIFLLLIIIFRFKANPYSGLGFIMLFFIVPYYNDMRFSIIGIIAYFLLIGSLFYLKEEKWNVIKGVIFGLISSGISYYFVEALIR